MQSTKSIAFDDERLVEAAAAASNASVLDEAENSFVERLKNGDPDAFDILVNRYSNEIYALLRRLVRDPDDAADLTQETFLSAVKAIKGFRGDSGLKTWMFRIAMNHARNQFRWWKRRHRDRSVSLDNAEFDGTVPLSEKIGSDSPGPEETFIRREREDAVLAELAELPTIFREVVVLCDIHGLGYEEIASMLEVNIGTVKSRISRGREELRKRLKDL
ncbi:sigma-70 family RNA polymerase sigma factor [Leptolyngbya sp. 7M]|uniref:sigma-70 family RNA polymerase sigma factor n=1 Tax=Leptolyngbya sp. 7M TaxID=2812896 RepID=UPI001B8CD991|nr:sigma-70 family RNA polymerase sigma factor [Leptolyngbya sp. 7M]QYO61941.1 sigma-70 family RNA polymerase sigma factor [Leptolyngbya sp. 7M]